MEFERPVKQLKTESGNSCGTEPISTPEASSSPRILTLENPDSPINPIHFYGDLINGVNHEEEVSTDNQISESAYVCHNYSSKAIPRNKRVTATATSHSQTRAVIAERSLTSCSYLYLLFSPVFQRWIRLRFLEMLSTI